MLMLCKAHKLRAGKLQARIFSCISTFGISHSHVCSMQLANPQLHLVLDGGDALFELATCLLNFLPF